MQRYRHNLLQFGGNLFLTDGGLETTLIYHDQVDLPHFAAFDLLCTPEGEATLRRYYRTYADLARRLNTGLILETPTWRASADWGARLGYSARGLAHANQQSVQMLMKLRHEFETERTPIVVSGCVGPRGDGYVPDRTMTVSEAEAYHVAQIKTLAAAGVDMIGAMTINDVAEAIGVVRAAQRNGLPVAISFTVETDGRLPTGQPLDSAIAMTDDATWSYASHYMINCAHPTHFADVLTRGGRWAQRIRGVRANASHRSHAELDAATELDMGDPVELGRHYAELVSRMPQLNILGGCCGTDDRHIEAIVRACLALPQAIL